MGVVSSMFTLITQLFVVPMLIHLKEYMVCQGSKEGVLCVDTSLG